jgi:hypothetical protein
MERLPWWRQPNAQDFNGLANDFEDRLRGDQAVADGTADNVRSLFALVRAQDQQVQRLEVVVQLMSDVLAASGMLDEKTLGARLEQALAAKHKQLEAERTHAGLICVRCGCTVPKRQTMMTGAGPTCAACYEG